MVDRKESRLTSTTTNLRKKLNPVCSSIGYRDLAARNVLLGQNETCKVTVFGNSNGQGCPGRKYL